MDDQPARNPTGARTEVRTEVEGQGQPGMPPVRRKLSALATMKAVLWSFFGVRKHSDYEQDSAQLNPVFVIIAGLLGGLLFVAVLITIARMVVPK